MSKILMMIGSFLLSKALKTMLLGAGIGLFTSKILMTLIDAYILKASSSLNSGASAVIKLLGLSGSDVALSVIVGALVAKATIEASKLGIKKLTA